MLVMSVAKLASARSKYNPAADVCQCAADGEARGEDDPEKGETRSLHAQEPGADRPDAPALDEGGDAGHKHRHGQKVRHVFAETQRSANAALVPCRTKHGTCPEP